MTDALTEPHAWTFERPRRDAALGLRGTASISCGPFSIRADERSVAEAHYVFREVFEERIYFRHGIELPPQSTILDLGANIGLFSLFALQQCPGCRLYAFEPVPPTFRLLQANLGSYVGEGHTVHVCQAAVSKECVNREITYFPAMPGNSTLAPERKLYETAEIFEQYNLRDAWSWNRWACAGLLMAYPFRKRLLRHFGMQRFAERERFVCTTVTLDDVFRELDLTSVQLLKIDAEGEELAILEGLNDEHLACVKQLVLELPAHERGRLPRLKERLGRCGFAKIFVDNLHRDSAGRNSAWPDLVYALR